jgi:hypothetical protein
MKTYFFILALFVSLSACAQQYKKSVVEIKEPSVLKLLGHLDTMVIKRAPSFVMYFLIVSNGSGSANIPQGDEASDNIMVSVSEYDEEPANKVFTVGPFLAPKLIFEGVKHPGSYTVTIEHGEAGKRQRSVLVVHSDKVVLQ